MEEVGKRRLTFGILVLFTITFIIMLSGFSSAAHMCADGEVILRLSDVTNAHGEAWSEAENYGIEICYNQIFGVEGSGDRSCGIANEFKVVGLSGSTNAHAENPDLPNYATDVCYKDLNCNLRSSCETEETEVLSLSSSTNAHLATAGGYSNKICCIFVGLPGGTCGDGIVQSPNDDDPAINEQCDGGTSCIAPGETNECQCPTGYVPDEDLGCEIESVSCEITSASWSETSTTEGTVVGLNVGTSNCEGQTVSFFVWEDDPFPLGDDEAEFQPLDMIIGSNSATGTWTAEFVDDGLWGGDPEYYFMATIGDEEIKSDDPLLEVSQIPSPCSLTSASWNPSGEVIEGTVADMIITGTDCNGVDMDFEIYENDLVDDDWVTTIDGNFDSPVEKWTTTWAHVGDDDSGQDPRDYYFKAIVVGTSESEQSSTLAVSKNPIDCNLVTLCNQYYAAGGNPTAEEACNADPCTVAEFSIEIMPGIDDDFCNSETTSCFCQWDVTGDVCNAVWEEIPPFCGNDIRDTGEVCDGTALDGYSCTDFDDFTGGTLVCNSNCDGFVTASCTGYSCNNDGTRDTGEACDGTDLGGFSCTDFDDFTGGTLGCNSACDFSTTLCTEDFAVCGDGNIDSGEQCDGTEFGNIPRVGGCSIFGLTGDLNCYAPEHLNGDGDLDECLINTDACTGVSGGCGNDDINPGETCDGTPPSGDWGQILSCTDFDNFDDGELNCGSDCQFDTGQCSISGPSTGGGECAFATTTTGSCEDGGFLSFSWIATWNGLLEEIPDSCKDGGPIITECPAQIQLAFFNLYNMLITLLAIAGIYGILSLKKKD